MDTGSGVEITDLMNIDTIYKGAAEFEVKKNLHFLDMLIIGIYLLLTFTVALYVLFKSNRSNVTGYFLAGRNVGWFPIGASLFSSNITSGSFIGLAGAGAASGISVGAYDWNGIIGLLILGWVFAPKYLSKEVTTLPEYLKKRFGGQRIQIYVSVLSLFMYILIKISSDLFSGAIFLKMVLEWNTDISLLVLIVITALYTVSGGLKAVIYTDTLQTFFMLIGTTILTVLAFRKIGGYEELKLKFMNATPTLRPPNSTCGYPPDDAFHMFHHATSDNMPWPGMLVGLTIIGIWYWCTDQVIAQRTLAAKSIHHEKGGCIFAGILKIFPMYMMVMVGMISRILYPDTVACAIPEECQRICGVPAGCSNIAYSKLVVEILPYGLKGLLLAAILAALMSSLSSVFNSASTLFTCDLWSKFRKKATERELMVVGRLFIVIVVLISFVWIPIIEANGSGQLFDYIQSITCYLTPPITVVYIMAVFWPRLNEKGAFWSLVIGFGVGVLRMVLDFAYGKPLCGQKEYRPLILRKVHYLHFAIILAALTCVVAVVVSLLTSKTRPINEKVKMSHDISSEELDEKQSEPNNRLKDPKEKDERKQNSTWRCLVIFCGLEEQKENISLPSHKTSVFKRHPKLTGYLVNVLAVINVLIVVCLFWIYR